MQVRGCWEVAVPSPPLGDNLATGMDVAIPTHGGAVPSDRLQGSKQQWDSSPVATAPLGLCAQPWPAQVMRTRGTRSGCPPPSLYQAFGLGPLHPQGCLPWIWHPRGHHAPQWPFWLLIALFIPFSPPEKLKNHKIIFVVGKSVPGPCRWGHGGSGLLDLGGHLWLVMVWQHLG